MKVYQSFAPNAATFVCMVAAAGASVGAYAQDAAAGKTVFAQCTACHSIDGKNGAGPSLKGVIGRTAGSQVGFHFSRAMMSAGIQWNADSLAAFIADPQKAVPGNVMPFSGIPDSKQRSDLIAFLQTLN